ncbi:MAG: hypothetical protein Q8K02_12350 [Flavobacterium sp.]|nr:hypothetical protein [Flavobacterium sp.]
MVTRNQSKVKGQKTKTLKRWSTFLLICLLSTSLWQCQKEELFETQSKSNSQNKGLKINLLKGKEARKIANRYKKDILSAKKSSLKQQGGISYRTSDDYTIKYDEILEVIDTLGNSNYTFRVVGHPDEDEKTFFNLVVNYNDGQVKVVLVKHKMSDSFSEDYYNGNKTLETFEGELRIIDIGSVGSNSCEDVIVEFNPDNAGGNQGATYPQYPGGVTKSSRTSRTSTTAKSRTAATTTKSG